MMDRAFIIWLQKQRYKNISEYLEYCTGGSYIAVTQPDHFAVTDTKRAWKGRSNDKGEGVSMFRAAAYEVQLY